MDQWHILFFCFFIDFVVFRTDNLSFLVALYQIHNILC
jgi:hypothetical protein